MSSATVTGPVDPADFDAATLAAVVAAATEADGAEPLNEAAVLALRHRGLAGSSLFTAGTDDTDGFAWVHGSADAPEVDPEVDPGSDLAVDLEVDLVVAPAARGRGVGTALASAVLSAVEPAATAAVPAAGPAPESAQPDGALGAWSHGNHPAAARLAERFGFERVRDLWVMRTSLRRDGGDDTGAVTAPDGVLIRTFVPGADEEAFLALNAEAFAAHPEQGRMTRADLDRRMAQPWFDAGGFFVAQARAGGAAAEGDLLGFHWTKVHPGEPPHGEVYVVGVSPAAQGLGLGRRLTLTGLHHLASLGLREVVLYVESDNAPAIAVYSGLGFTHVDADTHVRYERPRRT